MAGALGYAAGVTTRKLPARLLWHLRVVLAAAFLLLPAAPALAQFGNEELDRRVREADGRLRGYNETDVVLEGGDSPVYAYAAFIGLALVCTAVLFKDARRSHLD